MSDRPGGSLARVQGISWSPWRVFFAVAVPLFGVYLVTASWGPGYGVDAFTNLQAGYHIVNEQTVYIEGARAFHGRGWRR